MAVPIVYTVHEFVLEGLDMTALIDAAEVPSDTTGDSFPNTGKEVFLHINGSGTNDKTVVFEEGPCNYGTDHEPVRTTPKNTMHSYGPFPTSEFGSSIAVTYGGAGGVTDVMVLVLREPFTN